MRSNKYLHLGFAFFILYTAVQTNNATSSDKISPAINGYDTVAYFTLKKAIMGSNKYSHKWNDELWYFASKIHLKLFKENPSKYAPQFDGFCANGLSDGHAIEGDPENWRIIDGKLYLFFSRYGRNQWGGNVKALIDSAQNTMQDN